MQLYSTNNPLNVVSLKEAVFKGLPEDKGLFMPSDIPVLPASFFEKIHEFSFQDIGFVVAKSLFKGAIPDGDLREIIERALTFPAPVVKLDGETFSILELFHGPSLAFKDFGARFMAQLMSYFNRGEDKELVILVATSGDTGGAVAAGFYQTPGIKVVVLYPSGKVSPLQECQLTTLGHNITALEVDGTFDDCQRLVKTAFLDDELCANYRLSSANSINIARLVPQSFYYFEAYKQLEETDRPLAFCVPSGNFGNLTAGLMAKKMGLPVDQFIAATNVNDVVPEYLSSGVFTSRPSIRTLSNAMDVGNPSNFARMLDIYGGGLENEECSTWNNMKEDIVGFGFSDSATEAAMRLVYDKYRYIMDPHGAVGALALWAFQEQNPSYRGVVLETAHPSKFKEEVERILNIEIDVPARLAEMASKTKHAVPMLSSYTNFKDWLQGYLAR